MLKKIKKCLALLVVLATVFSLITVHAADTGKADSGAAYANFRNVTIGKIGKNNLYRSQHPANGSARSVYANKLAQENGIVTVLNLSDSRDSLLKYFKNKKIPVTHYYRALYNKGKVYTAHMGTGSHGGSSFRKKATSAVRFMAKNQGPYLIHCEIGRDRTGFVMLLLESLMGAPYDYMVNDFARSDMDRKGVSYAEAKSKAIKRLNDDLHYITGKGRKTNWKTQKLDMFAWAYLRKGGMSVNELNQLRKNLSVSYPKGGRKSGITAPAAPSTTTGKPTNQPASTNPAKTTDGKSTTAPKVTDGKNTTAPKATDGKSTTAPKATDGKSTTAPKATDGKSTTAQKATDNTGGKTDDGKSANSKPVQNVSKVNKETPAYRNLSIDGKTILTKEIRAGKKKTYTYKVQKGNVKKYPVKWTISNKSVVKVVSCGKGKIKIKGRKKGSAVITLYNKSDSTKRIKITVKVK